MTNAAGGIAANHQKKRRAAAAAAAERSSNNSQTTAGSGVGGGSVSQAQAHAHAHTPSESASRNHNAAAGSSEELEIRSHQTKSSLQSQSSLARISDNDGESSAAGISAEDESSDDGVRARPSPRDSATGVKRRCLDGFWWLNRARLMCGKFVNDERVQLFVVCLIAINAIMMGIGTFDFVTDNPEIDARFEIVDYVFLVIFTIELAMQFLYHGLRLFLDGWLVFDFVIIVMSWAFSSAQIIRAFRIFRALRLITRVEVMRNLVVALFSVMPRMAAIGLLLFLIFYIFAVMFTQLFKYMYHEGLTEYDYFSRLDSTFFTLFQIMTLDAWADVARDVMAVYPWAWLPFIAFVIISGFIVVNLIIAVICDAISALHDDERAKLHGTYESEIDIFEEEETQESDEQQIKALEGQIEELTRIQESTMMTLEYLTRQLEATQLQQSETSMSTKS